MFGTLVIDPKMTIPENTVNRLFVQLDSADATERREAREALAAYNGQIHDLLVEAVQEHRGYKSVEAAQLLLNQATQPEDDMMIDLLTSTHPMLGHIAFEHLQAQTSGDCIPKLLMALPYAIPTVQLRIIKHLGQQRHQEALHAFIAVLRYTQSVTVQAMIIDGLAALGDYRAVVFIQPFAAHENSHVRTAAQAAITKLTLH